MTADLSPWPDADALLDEALALPLDHRAAFVARAAGGDQALRAALEAVLAEAARDDGFLRPGGALSGSIGQEVVRSLEDDEEQDQIAVGTRIEHYEVVALLGRGGMGDVYRARDTRLQRDVALKVLPGRFAGDDERVARFRREAQVLAALNDPGIASIFGVAERDGLEALVLEYVDGPTLAERLAQGPLPLQEALVVGRRLGDAIAAAHVRGILHRDLKPANIKLTRDGGVKVLDFGLAKIMSPQPGAGAAADLSAAHPGAMLGTAAYMSPEQARGFPVDERSDIWAFGCLMFEMLTGTRAFPGRSTAEVLSHVVGREPAFGLLPTAVPPPIRRLLRRTLAKDPRRRLAHMADALLEFDDAVAAMDLPEPVTPPKRWRLAMAVVTAMVAGAGFGMLVSKPPATSPAPLGRFVMPLPEGDAPVTGYQPVVAVSPDSQTVVYRARRNGVTQLFRRSLRSLVPEPLPGTEGATNPFFSPDGRWLGFDADGVLKRSPISGGAPVVICPAPGGATASWAPDDTIVFATNTGRVLQRVAASGGEPRALTALDPDRGDTLHLLPQVLPNGRTVIFTAVSGAGRHVAALDMASGATRVLVSGTHGRYLAGGLLVFQRDDSLWAVGFDADRLEVAGQPVPLDTGIEHTDNTVFHYDVSASGALAYLPVRQHESVQQLVWIDRSGRRTPVDLEPRPYTRTSLAPDGTRVALAVAERGNTDIWMADLSRRTFGRLTFEPTIETMPAWSPDGRFIAFRSERRGPGIFRQRADGAGSPEQITETDGPIHSPYSWTPDGRTLMLAVFRSFRQQAIASVTPPDRQVKILLDGDFAQLDPQVSPDGRWLAYQSDETGRFEIYVRPYPRVESGRWQISTNGGWTPRWGPMGRELYYFDGSALVAVAVDTAPRFHPGPPRRLFDVAPFGGRLGPDIEVAPDGQRFLFIVDGPPGEPAPAQLVYVQRWSEEVGARVAKGP